MTALAARAGVSKGHLSSVENGHAGFSPENLARIAEVLNCTIADLMPEDSDTSAESAA